MPDVLPRFFFDYTDPLSYLVARQLFEGVDEGLGSLVSWTPFEIRPPPQPLVGRDDASLVDRWTRASAVAKEQRIELAAPSLVPWSRKAHELTLHAEERGIAAAVRARIFEAYFLRGADIGRVDVLVQIGREAGLDLTETKAVLDVDRFESAILEAREVGRSLGIATTPTVVTRGGRLEGFHNRTAIGTFLRA